MSAEDPGGAPSSPGSGLSVRPRGETARMAFSVAVRTVVFVFVLYVVVVLAWHLRLLLLLLAVSSFVAALLYPPARALRRRGASPVVATLVIYAALVILAGVLGYVIFNPVYQSATRFATQLPHLVRDAEAGRGQVGELVRRFHLVSYVQKHQAALQGAIERLGKPAVAVGKTVFSGVTSLVTILFTSFFIVLEGPGMVNGLLELLPSSRGEKIRHAASVMTNQVSGFMLGDLATSVIAGIVVFVTLEVTGVPFASVLAIWVGLVDFLPLVGGLLAGIPTVGVAFLHSVPAGIVTTIVFLVYQQVENHILYPVIVSRTVRLNPLIVLVSVLFGSEIGAIVGSTFGAICGAIFAVPLAGAIQVGGRELLAARQADLGIEEDPN